MESLSLDVLLSSELAANRFKGAVGRRLHIAVAGECEGGICEGNGLVVERVNIVVSDMGAVLVEPSGNLVVGGSPEIVVSEIA